MYGMGISHAHDMTSKIFKIVDLNIRMFWGKVMFFRSKLAVAHGFDSLLI